MGEAEPAADLTARPQDVPYADDTIDWIRRVLPAAVALVLFVAALEVLRRELHSVTWQSLSARALGTPPWLIAAAFVLTAINYLVLTGYDFIALASIGRPLPAARVAVTSFLAYAIANSVGLSMLSGASVRYRFYSRWGITGQQFSQIVISYSVTFWLGLLALGGLTLVFSPLRADLPLAHVGTMIGVMLFSVSVAYVVAAAVRRRPFTVNGFQLPLPSGRLALLQLLLSSLDWVLAGAVLYVLLPRGAAPFTVVLSAFVAAQILGLAAHVPGGVGIFEGVIVLLLKPYMTSMQLAPALVAYRAIYYLAPLCVALVVLAVAEIRERRHLFIRPSTGLGTALRQSNGRSRAKANAARLTAAIARVAQRLTPRLLAALTFVAGVVLLFSGATPAAAHRLAVLDRLVPLGVIETSHIIGSVAGALLLLLSQGLSRRLDAAYYLTTAVIGTGIVASLFKGVDYEEAIGLGLLLLMLRRARPLFDRKAALLATRFSPAWIAAVVAALSASIWLGLFAFKHVEFSTDLWWQFALQGEASRALRGAVAAATVVLLVAVARLIGHAPHEVEPPSDDDLSTASRIIARQDAAYPNLIYLRDKALLFDDERDGLVMYAVKRRTWVALGDPIGPSEKMADLIRLFIERCDDFGGTPVFYEVGKHHLHRYADFGMAFIKLGEEARVDLARFSLEGREGSRFRQVVRRLAKDGATFRVIPAEDVPGVIDRLREVSDDWLAQKTGAEKGFSVGFFDAEYLGRFPVAVVERGNRIVAFANLWPGPGGHELSIDLMRYHRDAPTSAMEALIVHLLLWGQSQGYRWFALGMAPMSGAERSPIAPLRARAGNFLYEHGGILFNFRGLRAYKEKFNPVWEPRYLVYPGALTLPRIVADVSALVAGGYGRIFHR
jgi:phosphatidylglycerol lysyltransferase